MEKLNILIVSNYFYPQNTPRAFRTTELAKQFSKQGHNVKIITPKDESIHVQFENDFGVKIKNLGKPLFKEIKTKSYFKFFELIKRGVRRALLQLFQYPRIDRAYLVKKALHNESGHDLMISIASPHSIHWGTAWSRNKKKPIAKIWVADCGDPFMGSTIDTFSPLFYFKFLEKYWNRKCDFISIPFKGAKDGYYKEYRKKIRIIPQGFNFEDVEVNSDAYEPNKIPTFAYAGGFIPGARDPKEFIEYLLSQNIEFRFIVYTNTLNLIQPFLVSAREKIEIRNYIPRKKLLLELSKMDFIVNYNNGNNTQLPSKLIDYYLAKRPVLSLDSFDLNKTVVDQFLEGNYLNQYKFNNTQQYRIENVCEEFLKLSVENDVI